MAADDALRALILNAVPQQPPFRFIEEIIEMDGECIAEVHQARTGLFRGIVYGDYPWPPRGRQQAAGSGEEKKGNR